MAVERVAPTWQPSVQDVADHILLRTKSRGGRIMETFTASDHDPASEQTIPSAETVTRFIVRATDRVVTKLGHDIADEEVAAEAQDMAAIRAAMLVELNFYAEQIESDHSPYRELKQLWEDAMGGDETGTGDTGTTSDVVGAQDNSPSFSFPQPDLVPLDSTEWHPQYGYNVPDAGLDLGEA